MAVTPVPGNASVVVTGGVAVDAVLANPNGGFITNPVSSADQGIDPPEDLYINAIDAATLVGNGNTFVLAPGQTWLIIPGQTTKTSVNALTSGHKFSVLSY